MKLNELKVPKTATTKATKRLGRGPATGQGCTAGHGQNGQNSRSGGGVRLSFEGGQMPLIRRLPKRGFFNLFRKTFEIVNLADIVNRELNGEITPEVLKTAGLIRSADAKVKVLGDGDISSALTFKVHAYSKTAREKIEKAGGTAEVLS